MFILSAFADVPAAPQEPPVYHVFIMFALMFLILYFLLIRPQKKRQDEHRLMLESLKKGDDVVAAGGLLGQVADVREDHYVLKIADNVRVKVTKPSITQKLTAPGQAIVEEKGK